MPSSAITSVLSNIVYVINGITPVSDLRGTTHEGDTVQVSFTVAAGTQPQRFTLVSYTAPGAAFDANTAAQQKIFDTDTGVFGPGTYTLTVSNPHSYFQVDFVAGSAIDQVGPGGQQHLLFDAESPVQCRQRRHARRADFAGFAVRHRSISMPITTARSMLANGPIAGVKVTATPARRRRRS